MTIRVQVWTKVFDPLQKLVLSQTWPVMFAKKGLFYLSLKGRGGHVCMSLSVLWVHTTLTAAGIKETVNPPTFKNGQSSKDKLLKLSGWLEDYLFFRKVSIISMIVQSMIIIGIAYFKSMIGHFIYPSLNDICTHSDPLWKRNKLVWFEKEFFHLLKFCLKWRVEIRKKEDIALRITAIYEMKKWLHRVLIVLWVLTFMIEIKV